MTERHDTLAPGKGGLTGAGLRSLGIVFLVIGIAGVSILENRVLQLPGASNSDLLETMDGSNGMMTVVTAALVCRALYLCAVPIFAFLLVEGFLHTENFRAYLLRVLLVAVISEVPYNLAMGGQWLDTAGRNPAFGMAVALVMLRLLAQYEGGGARNICIQVLVALAAFCWSGMLKVDEGGGILLMTLTLWLLRNRQAFRGLAGCAGAFVCCIFSPYYIASPMSMMVIHLYNGEKGGQSKVWKMAAYPAVLTVFAVLTMIQ